MKGVAQLVHEPRFKGRLTAHQPLAVVLNRLRG